MMCDECGIRPAQFHLTTISGEEKTERNLCPVCMAKYQKQIPGLDFTNLAGLISGFLESAAAARDGEEQPDENAQLTCPNCGTTYAMFQKSGMPRLRPVLPGRSTSPWEAFDARARKHAARRTHPGRRQKRRFHPHEHRTGCGRSLSRPSPRKNMRRPRVCATRYAPSSSSLNRRKRPGALRATRERGEKDNG